MSKITTEQATQLMFDFITHNLKGMSKVRREDNDIIANKDGIDFVLRTAAVPLRPASAYISRVKQDGKNKIAHSPLLVRSTLEYDGKFLRQAVHEVNGKNRYWTNKKQLTTFEQQLTALFGSVPYFNHSTCNIEIIKFIRGYIIPNHIKRLENSESSEQRQRYHIHEDLREKIRKISITERINGNFTLEIYERISKPLVARITAYKP